MHSSFHQARQRGVRRLFKHTSLGALLLVAAVASPVLARPAHQPSAQDGISPQALQRISALQAEKQARTPTQRKIDSNLLAAVQQQRGQASIAAAALMTGVETDAQDTTLIDLRADVSDALLAQVRALGGRIEYTSVPLRTVVARVPLDQIERLAALPEVRFVLPHRNGQTMQQRQTASAPSIAQEPFAARVEHVRTQLSTVLSQPAPLNVVNQQAGSFQQYIPLALQPRGGNVSQGDVTHRAAQARSVFAVNGRGVTIGVLSDGVDSLARAQSRGDLPRDVTVLPGQNGSGDEGTAMLEIVHDLAPGARLLFATGFESIESFADNIRALRSAGADIIVDDIIYLDESPFQLGQGPTVFSQYNGGVVSQAVNDVVRSGALYFSSAGNEGNLNDGTSGVWEGNFANGGATTAPLPSGGTLHDFDPSSTVRTYNTLTNDTNSLALVLQWSDPLGGSMNDYDLYVLNSTGTQVIAASNGFQTGTQDPNEAVIGEADFNLRGVRFVVVRKSGAQTRYLHLNTNRGRLQIGTDGQIYGHPAVPTAVGVAATPAGPAPAPAAVQGPFPNPFSSANVVERFSSDGPRQFFYTENSLPITPGNVLEGGGQVVLKPDVTAADGVSTQADPQAAFNPFFGTSAAAPHAAAIAALVKQANPALSSQQILDVMRATAIDIETPGFDRDSGVGILDAYRAVSQAR